MEYKIFVLIAMYIIATSILGLAAFYISDRQAFSVLKKEISAPTEPLVEEPAEKSDIEIAADLASQEFIEWASYWGRLIDNFDVAEFKKVKTAAISPDFVIPYEKSLSPRWGLKFYNLFRGFASLTHG